jgi:ABC-type glycerol-3-phosphate transport system substrate-binding protein
MTRTTIVSALALALTLASCGGRDDASQAAKEAKKSTDVTVQSAGQPGEEKGPNTEVPVESAEPEQKPAKD